MTKTYVSATNANKEGQANLLNKCTPLDIRTLIQLSDVGEAIECLKK